MIVHKHERKQLAFKLMLLDLFFSTILLSAIIYGTTKTLMGF